MAHPPDVDKARNEEMLSAYRELQSQFERVRDRLRRAEEQKGTVSRRIFDRVRAEYDRELDAIRAKMTPLRDELDEMRGALESQIREAGESAVSIEEELAEVEFRNRIGEYSAADFEAARRALEERVSSARSRHDELKRSLATLDAMKDPDATDAEVLADEPVEEPAPKPARTPRAAAPPAESAARRPVLRAADVAPAGADHFENPQDWIDEIGRDVRGADRRSASKAAPAANAEAARPAGGATAVAATPAARGGTPSLVFVRGTHAGQSIALLPTTLTIGREHDNNVEIKDAEVGRYHARIIHERGRYVLEDLDSSTGTWVNGQRTRRALLVHGDVIRVGQTELAFDAEWTSGSR